MTRALTIGVMLAALAAPAALSAQTSAKPVTFGVSGGLSLPIGEFGEARNSGYSLAGHAYFKPVSLPMVRLRADMVYDDWDLKEFDSKTRSIAVVGNVVYDFPAQSTSLVHPYVLGGLGVFSFNTLALPGALQQRASDTNLGVQLGGGLAFHLSGFSTFVEAKLVSVYGDGVSTRYVPVTFGVRF